MNSEGRNEVVRKRRVRYAGTHPGKFSEKYKEHQPERYAETVQKVIESGKTPAGTHRPILVNEIIEALRPEPGACLVDCTLGYGGHSQELLRKIEPGGKLIGLDRDGIQLPKTAARLKALGFTIDAHHSNFAGLPGILASAGWEGADGILADLGVSSMQLDDPGRGFSTKLDGPLDMRMNPASGQTASHLLSRIDAKRLTEILQLNADEPHAAQIADGLAGRLLETTGQLAERIRKLLHGFKEQEVELSVRRAFQAIRISVNDEFGALDSLLRVAPGCLKSGGRIAILTFHSGEDRRVKKAFETGFQSGSYSQISEEVIRPGPEERRSNSRSISAKLRWATGS